jgi:hypothetical protein
MKSKRRSFLVMAGVPFMCGFIGCLLGCQSRGLAADQASAPPPSLGPAIKVSKHAFDPSKETFERHGNYLSLSTPYEPLKPVFHELEQRLDRKLITRGEAHVTVITPPEYEELKRFVSMREIDQLVSSNELSLQKSTQLEPVCLGRAEAKIGGKLEQAYYIVVRSEQLLKIRRAISDLYVKKGGDASRFKADWFYPHITVGFTKTDIHESQGAIKDAKSCLYSLELAE